jgi:hypothetical protein
MRSVICTLMILCGEGHHVPNVLGAFDINLPESADASSFVKRFVDTHLPADGLTASLLKRTCSSSSFATASLVVLADAVVMYQ